MPILNKLTGAFLTTLFYITAGILIDIWSLAWFVSYPPEDRGGYFWIVGFMLTGLALFIIGLFLGRIGRAARQAELPPEEVTTAVAQVEKVAAENLPAETPPLQEVPAAPAPIASTTPVAPAQAAVPPPPTPASPSTNPPGWLA
jgi:hypothetical protein